MFAIHLLCTTSTYILLAHMTVKMLKLSSVDVLVIEISVICYKLCVIRVLWWTRTESAGGQCERRGAGHWACGGHGQTVLQQG